MGTSLTGLEIKDTYDGLVKTTDNGPLSGSLKKLTDGLGNDSSLSLSTTAASFSGTLAVSGASTFSSAITMALGGTPRLTLQDTDAGAGNVGILFQESTSPKWTLASNSGSFQFFNEATASNAIWVSSTNNVGIGTSSPTGRLTVYGEVDVLADPAGAGYGSRIGMPFNVSTYDLAFYTRSNTATFTERVRILSGGGITFNGDTAAANALDDYEEGTWTMGISFSGASVGVTYGAVTGTYTKIGRQVTINGLLSITDKGTSTGYVQITGLPFTIASTNGNYSGASISLFNVSFADQFFAYGEVSTTTIAIEEISSAGVVSDITDADFANNSSLVVSMTYFV